MTQWDAATMHPTDCIEPCLPDCLRYCATCRMSTTCQYVLILRSTTGEFWSEF